MVLCLVVVAVSLDVMIAASICRSNMKLIPCILVIVRIEIEHYILLCFVLCVVSFDIALCSDDIEPFCPSASVHIS
jgi:hypothetical protein